MQCPCPPVIVNPLCVSIQPNGKKRLILDLRQVNFFVKKSKIKFEDAKSFLDCLVASPCTWACSFDIKSGYHHIEIFESDQQFLGFSWVFDGVTKYFKFTVLPFVLSVGPYIFSKVMRPLVKYWYFKAIRIVVYLDDGISAATNFSKCQGNSLLVRSDLFKPSSFQMDPFFIQTLKLLDIIQCNVLVLVHTKNFTSITINGLRLTPSM